MRQESGWNKEVSRVEHSAGRAQMWCRPGRYIGIDIGGTKIAGSLLDVSASGVCRVLKNMRVPARRGSRQVVEDVTGVVFRLMDQEPSGERDGEALNESSTIERFQVDGIGLCVPGRVNPQTGVVENVANLDISELALTDEITRNTGLPAHVENDVNAATLGAYVTFGDSGKRGVEDESAGDVVAFLNLGTGLAAGVLRDGVLDNGFSGVVGEIGHIPVERHRLLCGCGQRGCLETVAGGNAIMRQWPQVEPPMPDIIARAHDVEDSQCEAAREVLATIVGAVVDAIDILALAVDPRIILIGGGTARTGIALLDEIRIELRKRAATSPFIASLSLDERVSLVSPDEPIGCIGAACAMSETLN